jgi:pimeloyl-ACP methyl ester carboxylesterase
LDELIELARRDRPSPGALTAVARALRVPFVAVPVAATVVPSSAFGALAAKLGISRLALFGWSAGAAVAATGVAAAVAMHEPPRVAPVATVAPSNLAAHVMPEPAQMVPAPERSAPSADSALPAPSSERHAARDLPATWDEPQLIERARKALSTDPRRALALAQEHQRRFPGGAMSVEREVIVMQALARSGQPAEARRRALSFEARYPNSIHLPQVRALLAKLGT